MLSIPHEYMVYSLHEVTLFTACPIEGQVRRECASHPDCHRTCNTTGPVACPRVCIVYGCECPNGTVIDEDTNACVTPNECTGTIIDNYKSIK